MPCCTGHALCVLDGALPSMLEPSLHGTSQACGGVRAAGAAVGGGGPQAAAAVVSGAASCFLATAGVRARAPAAARQARSGRSENKLRIAVCSVARCGIVLAWEVQRTG